jgi:bacterioferritin-associated ferredoxin
MQQTVLTIIRIRVQIHPMIVCVCKAVSDRHIKAAVKGGAACMRDITRELGVGTCCGKCVPAAKVALSASLAHHQGSATFFQNPSTEFAV